jgi:hypothetical protein
MSLSSITNYFTNHAASILNAGLPSSKASAASSANTTGLSPFGQLLSTLQQLQQSNPAQYRKVTQQISTNLQTAAAADTKSGHTAQAAELTTLSKDFTAASQTSQLPNVHDLVAAIGGAHHYLAHASPASGSTTGSASSAGANATLQQLLASFQSGANQNTSTNPMSIIMSTLSGA